MPLQCIAPPVSCPKLKDREKCPGTSHVGEVVYRKEKENNNISIAQPRIVCTEILLKAVDAHQGRQVQCGVGSRSQNDTCGAHAPLPQFEQAWTYLHGLRLHLPLPL